MTQDEYNKLFHQAHLNLVAFKPLMQCDKEVLRLVNIAIAAEREACAKVCDEELNDDWDTPAKSAIANCAAAIRARGEK